jgi:hypothetical protein
MVTFGVHIREQAHNKGRKLERQGEKEELCGSKANEECELPQGAKFLHLGGLVLPFGGFDGKSWASVFWASFAEVWKRRSVGGMCEAEVKSMKSAKTKRRQVCG